MRHRSFLPLALLVMVLSCRLSFGAGQIRPQDLSLGSTNVWDFGGRLKAGSLTPSTNATSALLQIGLTPAGSGPSASGNGIWANLPSGFTGNPIGITINGGTPLLSMSSTGIFSLSAKAIIANTESVTSTYDLGFGGAAAHTIGVERWAAAGNAGSNLSINGGSASSGGTDKAGGTLNLNPGLSTGTGIARVQIRSVVPAGVSGTADNGLVTFFTVDGQNLATSSYARVGPNALVAGTGNGNVFGTNQSTGWTGYFHENELNGVLRFRVDSTGTATTAGNVITKRVTGGSGTAHATTDWGTLTGWGTGVTLPTTVTGTDLAFTATFTAAASPSANPTAILTFKDGTWTTTPIPVLGTGVGTGTPALWSVTAISATTMTVQFNGTPVSGSTYTLNGIVVGR